MIVAPASNTVYTQVRVTLGIELVDPAPESALHEVQQQNIGTPRLLGGKVGGQLSTDKLDAISRSITSCANVVSYPSLYMNRYVSVPLTMSPPAELLRIIHSEACPVERSEKAARTEAKLEQLVSPERPGSARQLHILDYEYV